MQNRQARDSAAWLGKLKPGSVITQRGWVGREAGEVQEGADTGEPVADSCWCVAETNTVPIILQLKVNK